VANIDWARAISGAAVKLDTTVSKLTRYLALQILRGVILKTPVDTGHLRAAWAISSGASPVIITQPGDAGPKTVAAPTGALDALYPVIWITNGLPYAAVVEYGLWPGVGPKTQQGANPSSGAGIFSRQAPAGMVELTLLELESSTIASLEAL
jgi:hypothetical protein